jgi:hypothetical protein
MKKRPRGPTFREILDEERTQNPPCGTEPLRRRPNPVDEGYLVDDEVRIWTLRRPATLSYSKAAKLLPSVDAMIMDSYPLSDRQTVPAEERAAALASVESNWNAHYGSAFSLGDVTYEGYEFEDHDGRLMLYLQHWCG